MWYLLALLLLSQGLSHVDMIYAGTTPQSSDWDCALACAETLLTWAGIGPQPHLWQEILEPGRPIPFLHLRQYFAAHQLQAVGYRLTWGALSRFLEGHSGAPLLAHLDEGSGHFVLIWGITPAGVLTGDPAHGVHLVPAETFQTLWTGACLYFPQLGSMPGAIQAGEEAQNRIRLLTAAGLARP